MHGNYFCCFTFSNTHLKLVEGTPSLAKWEWILNWIYIKNYFRNLQKQIFMGPAGEMLKNVAACCWHWQLITIIYRRERKGWGNSRYLKEVADSCSVYLELSFRLCYQAEETRILCLHLEDSIENEHDSSYSV